jgi:GNAT superfamily N-acetyltransferase/uncharacterized glyoxalase superfamily protein PhnB
MSLSGFVNSETRQSYYGENYKIMQNEENVLQPVLSFVEPVLAVQDVSETILYWQDVLGFPGKWTWGKPPNHGGVSWNGVSIQFSLDPKLALVSEGHSIWIRVQRLEELYNFHQKKNAKIAAPLETQPWGMAQYTVQEMNGYFLHFAAPVTDRKPGVMMLPESIRVIERTPTIKEYLNLISAVGWSSSMNDATVQVFLSAAVFAVVAEDTLNGNVVGCAFLLGDNASFYYVKDVMVHPDWQGKRVGTALMQALTRWLENNATNNALVGLYTGENLTPFYQQFGFAQAFGMNRYIRRNEIPE